MKIVLLLTIFLYTTYRVFIFLSYLVMSCFNFSCYISACYLGMFYYLQRVSEPAKFHFQNVFQFCNISVLLELCVQLKYFACGGKYVVGRWIV